MTSAYRLDDVPTWDDLRKIEDYADSVDRVEEDTGRNPILDEDTGTTEAELLVYATRKELYRRESATGRIFNPSAEPNLATKLLRNDLGYEMKAAQVAAAGALGAFSAATTGNPLSATWGTFMGYGMTEAAVRGAGYLWNKGRDREEVVENPDFSPDTDMEEILDGREQ